MATITMQKIKVLRIISRLNIGGPSIHVKVLTEGVDNEIFESKLLVGNLSKNEGDMSYILNCPNGNVEHISMLQREINPLKDFVAFLKLFIKIARIKPDIVHTHLAKAGILGRVAAILNNLFFRRNIMLVHTYHGNVLDGYFNPTLSFIFLMIEKIAAKFTAAIIAISQTQKWELVDKYQISRQNKVYIINLGLNLKPFLDFDAYRGLFRKKLGLDDSCVIIGIVGRLVPIKNHKMFLDAAESFLNNNSGIDARFVLIGDGELRKQLISYADQIGIRDNVIFWGWEHEVRKVYCGLDILALTSNNEGTPVSIIEAMASGVPVITTGVGGVKDLLGSFEINKKNEKSFKICERGILCQKGDHIGMAKGIQFILSNEDMGNEKRIARSKAYVFANYTDSSLIRKMEHLYKRLAKLNRII